MLQCPMRACLPFLLSSSKHCRRDCKETHQVQLQQHVNKVLGSTNTLLSIWWRCWAPGLQGIHAVRQHHDCDYVHLRLSFKRGLHPFYPPVLDLLHPRMKGPVHGALASHPIAQLRHWDPWGTQRELAAKLKAFLEVALQCMTTGGHTVPSGSPFINAHQVYKACNSAVPPCVPFATVCTGCMSTQQLVLQGWYTN